MLTFLVITCCVLILVVAVQRSMVVARNALIQKISSKLTTAIVEIGDLQEIARQQTRLVETKNRTMIAQDKTIEHLKATIEILRSKELPLAKRPAYDYDKLPKNRNDL